MIKKTDICQFGYCENVVIVISIDVYIGIVTKFYTSNFAVYSNKVIS